MEKLDTGVPGLDTVLNGGIPKGSLVLVGGPPGAGKTILTTQIAFYHAGKGKRTLMLTALSEANAKLIAYLNGLEFFDTDLIGNELQILNIQKMLTDDGLDATLAEIRSTVLEQGIHVLIIDSVRSLYTVTGDQAAVQSFIFSLGSALFMVGCTTILVEDQYALDSGGSPEQAISDTILQLRVETVGRRSLRRLEVVKMRGANPLGGIHAFDITGSGVSVYPRIESLPAPATTPTGSERLSWGVPGLDRVTGGGIPMLESTLLVGTTGMGKTTLCLQFVAEGVSRRENSLYLSLHETADQLVGKARGLGIDVDRGVQDGSLAFLHVPPWGADVDRIVDGLIRAVDQRQVSRLVIDTLDPIERDATREDRYTDMIGALARFLRANGTTVLMARDLSQLVGQALEIYDSKNSYWLPVDNVVLMRPAEVDGGLHRVLSVLKMRSSDHDDSFYNYEIAEGGIRVAEAIEGMQGLLTGLPRRSV